MELVASAARPRSAANGCLGVGDSPTCVAAPPGPGGAAQPNLEGAPLATCSLAPRTGWFRDGTCATDERDAGVHVVCAEVTAAFLAFSRDRGNDLMTPVPSAAFPGLQPGDRWCLCAARWEEARVAGVAPPVIVEATHARAAELVDPAELRAHARDQP